MPTPDGIVNYNLTQGGGIVDNLTTRVLYISLPGDEVPVSLLDDIDTLTSFLSTPPAPDASMLHQYFTNSSHWDNSSWAAALAFSSGGDACAVDIDSLKGLETYQIEGCLSTEGDEHCELLFSPLICLVVILCNTAKVVCMFLTARDNRKEILLTVGDAIASFLNRPDPHTAGWCLMSKSNISNGPLAWTKRKQRNERRGIFSMSPSHSFPEVIVPEILPDRKRRWRAASVRRWGVTFGLYVNPSLFLNPVQTGVQISLILRLVLLLL